ncbi:hypothetical protein LOTGIDRAFT_169841 [Lottia gigantea]|uniref:Uncharacterized protein n=1 Tax=Lottia gigantea TaxID=225164 RepID=V3ZFW0_LOTGI|nr:hypothetical protein LOTGIDRAFT_169841 [Lottia gigantea]ESO83012.1 hypothetical protein LOTGIDRAFT_169841 [Lottia gigantea]
MEHIIPEKFIKMCRLLEITTFPVHWKFEEKDQQIVVTFIWNIGSSEILNPQDTPKADSTVAFESKRESEIQKQDLHLVSKKTASHQSPLKSETPDEDANSKDKRKSASSSRTTLPAASTDDRKSITTKHKEKSVNNEDGVNYNRCEKTPNDSSTKQKHISGNANVCLVKTNELKKSDAPKPHKESSTKHRHSSSDSERKRNNSSSKDTTKGLSNAPSSCDPKRRHFSSKSKSTSSSGESANPEIRSNIEVNKQTVNCEDTKITRPQNRSAQCVTPEVKNKESRHKESSIRKESKSKDSNSQNDKNHKEKHMPDEKRHVKPNSRDQKKHTEASLRHSKEIHESQSCYAAVTDTAEVEHPKEPHHADPIDSDDSFTELKIDLDYDESKSSKHEEENLRIDKECQPHTCATATGVQESNQEMHENPPLVISRCEPKDDSSHIDEVTPVGKEDPAITATESNSQDTNTSKIQNPTSEDRNKVSASSDQKISQNEIPKNMPQEERIQNSNPDKDNIDSDKLEKREISSNQPEVKESASGILDKEEIDNSKQKKEKFSTNKLENNSIHNNVAKEKEIQSKSTEEQLCTNPVQEKSVLNNSNNQEKAEVVDNDLEEGEIEDEDIERDRPKYDQNKNTNVVTGGTVFDNVLLAYSPVSSIEPQTDEEPLGILGSNDPFDDASSPKCQVGNRTKLVTTAPTADGIQTPSSYSFQTEDLEGASRASTPLLDEMNGFKVLEDSGFRTVILPVSQSPPKQCSPVKSQVTIPRRKKRKGKRKSISSEAELMNIFQGEKLSKRKSSRLRKKLQKQLSKLSDSGHEDIEGRIKKEQKRANQGPELWSQPEARGTQEHSTRKKRHVTDWDKLLQKHIHEKKRPTPTDTKTEDLKKKIDNFLIEIDLKNNKKCSGTFLTPNQTYKETHKVHQRPMTVSKQVNFGNLFDVQSYTSGNGETFFDEREQIEHDSLMDSIIISSTYKEEEKEKTSKKRKRHTDGSDSETDPGNRKLQRTNSRSLPRMNRDIAIQQRNNPDTGLHQYLFLFEDSRPCTWIDSDEIQEHNPHFYNSLKKCFVPKEGSQEQSELQQKLYNLVGFPS